MFSPHSKARLVLLLVLAPVFAAIEALRRGGEHAFVLWLTVTVAAMVIVVTAWSHARRETKQQAPFPPPPPPVLADQPGPSSLGRLATPFLVSFLLTAAFLFLIDPGAPRSTLVVSAGAGVFFGFLWHLRGTIPGLILLSLAGGAVVTLFVGFLSFIGSLWGADDGYNWVAWWLGSSAVIAPCLWPVWRPLRNFELRGPVKVAAILAVVMTFVIAATTFATEGDVAPSDAPPDRSWAEVHGAAAPEGAPSENDAAARLFAAWRFGNREGAKKVASPEAISALFAIAPSDRDRLLGCGTFDGSFSECRIESAGAGIISLDPLRGPNGTFWIGRAAITPAP